MRDERNDLIRVGDALDAITDWLCEEELRHNIEPKRRVNKFFAKVMLENVPRADHKSEPQVEEERAMKREDAIYWIKNLAVISTEKDMPQIKEALNMAVEALQDEVWKDESQEE